MKKYFLSSLICIAAHALMAQTEFDEFDMPPGEWAERIEDRREEIEKRKVAYLSTELSLSVEEAQQFWPVYNSHKEKMAAHMKKGYELRQQSKDGEQLTMAQLDTQMKNHFEQERARIALDEAYYAQLKKVLPADKIAHYFKAERDFKRELMRSLRNRAQEGSMRPGAPGRRPER